LENKLSRLTTEAAAERLAARNDAMHAAVATAAELLAYENEARHAALVAGAKLLAAQNETDGRQGAAAAPQYHGQRGKYG
jgi:hypothetical protein